MQRIREVLFLNGFKEKYYSMTIKTRLLLSSLAIVLFITVIFISLSTILGAKNGEQLAYERLESVATLKEAELNNWADGLRTDLAAVILDDEEKNFALELLEPSDGLGQSTEAYNELDQRFTEYIEKTHRLDEIFLVNLQRQVVLSTDHWREGGYGTSESNLLFPKALEGDYLHPPSYTLSLGGIAITIARPIFDADGKAVGILVGRTSTEKLSEIMLERAGLGETGETFLVNSSHIMLTEARFPEPSWYNLYYIFTDGTKAAVDHQQDGFGVYDNYRQAKVLGVYKWLPDLEVALFAEQNRAEAMAPTITSLIFNGIIAILSGILTGLISLYMARTITEPLANLVATTRAVANGDLQQTVDIERQDEIGALASAFNRMTEQLRDFVNNLEQEVKDRTESLESQTLKLETSARVSQEITSILDIDDLLARVVELIQQAFHYDHVAIYLLNDETRQLFFMAGTGEMGRLWSTNGQQIPIESGSVLGKAVIQKQAIVIDDIRQDPLFIADKDLPEAKAGIVLPLLIQDRVLGVMVVQSASQNDFDKGDGKILQSLGDQVAIAIENAHLYTRVRLLATIDERQRLAHELHDYVTQSLYGLVLYSGAGIRTLASNDLDSTHQHLVKVSQIANQVLKEMRLLLYQLRKSDHESLIQMINQRLEMVENRMGIDTVLDIEENLNLKANIEDCLSGIIQEAMNNALRYSNATKVIIRLRAEEKWVKAEIIDDGEGFNVNEVRKQGGMGLQNMQERADQVNGSLSIISTQKCGTKVCVLVPLNDYKELSCPNERANPNTCSG